MTHELTWTADPDRERRRRDLLDQLLACYQQALGHKLPNQLITIGGLTNLLEHELKDKLDAETRGFLERLVAAARETGDLMRTFADLGRLCRADEPSVSVELAEAVREATAVVKVLYPQRQIEYHLQREMPTVIVPRRPLHLAVLHLLRLIGAEGATAVRITAETTPQGVALHVAGAGRVLSEHELTILFQRMSSGSVAADQGVDMFLVRQAVALWGGGVRLQVEPGQGNTFTLLFPPPPN
jgi:light-regulated signal transduction histidine kinase (bacteriophytochrome)